MKFFSGDVSADVKVFFTSMCIWDQLYFERKQGDSSE